MVLSVQLFVYVITNIFIIFVCLLVRFSINSIHACHMFIPALQWQCMVLSCVAWVPDSGHALPIFLLFQCLSIDFSITVSSFI